MYKKKAVFMIVLMISTIIYSPNMFGFDETEGCCEKTLGGDLCIPVDQEQCSSGFHSGSTCDTVTNCQIGCCSLEDGSCSKSVPKSTCDSLDGNWNPDETCSISACQKSCCILGENCLYTTQRTCALESREIGYEMNFQTVSNEASCLEMCEEEKTGCCIEDDLTCNYGSAETCSGEFFSGKYCSEIDDCFCKSKDHKGCVNDDVYWFDSCGNLEIMYKDCSYEEGNKCREEDGKFDCRSLDCEDTYSPPEGTNLHDDNMGGFRRNGESWCVYESGTGNFTDRPGSRHYMHMCFEGEEILQECSDFREEVCVQGEVTINGEDFNQANCIDNFNASLTTVPFGFDFWNPQTEGIEICDAADLTCPITVYRKNNLADWRVEPVNCTERGLFVDPVVNFCRSLGDCGPKTNVLGERSESGFSVSFDRDSEWHGKKPTWDTYNQNLWQGWENYGVFGGVQVISEFIDEIDDPDLGVEVKEVAMYSAISALVVSSAIVMIAGTGIGLGTAISLSLGLAPATSASILGTTIGGTSGGLIGASTALAWMPYVTIAIIALALLSFLVLGNAESHDHYVATDCNIWTPPTINNCSACNEPWKICSEYKCKSLGTNCEFFNEGTGNETCLEVNINDVNGPLIEPWEEALTSGYSIVSEGTNGYQISPQVEAYKTITLGIKTFDPGRNEYEPTQCKIDLNRSATLDDMQGYYLSDSIYVEEHFIELNLEPNKQFTYWIMCQDGAGNPSVPYQIKLQTKAQPDLNAPIIYGTSIENGAYVPYDIKQTELILFTNEPVSCRWDQQDLLFEEMGGGVSFDIGMDENMEYYESKTALTNITNEENNIYYFRCEDDAGNVNSESYQFNLYGSSKLEMGEIKPSGTVLTNNFTLETSTFGGGDGGRATCTYGVGTYSATPFEITGETIHSQSIEGLNLGTYEYYISCSDSVGNNVKNKTEIIVDADVSAPDVLYIYKDTASIHLILREDSYCEYGNVTFNYGSGTEMAGGGTDHHTAVLQDYYYVLCEDIYGNQMDPINIYSEMY